MFEILKIDNRVHVYNQINGGASSARNKGLANCNGDYIVFVDSDDLIDNKGGLFFNPLSIEEVKSPF